MKFAILFSSFITLGCLAAPTPAIPNLPRGLFGSITGALQNLGNDLQNATLTGLASTVAQSVENPTLTKDRIQVVTGLAASAKALTAITTAANTAQNNQVMSFAAQGAQGLSTASSAVSRIGQSLITGYCQYWRSNGYCSRHQIRSRCNQLHGPSRKPGPC